MAYINSSLSHSPSMTFLHDTTTSSLFGSLPQQTCVAFFSDVALASVAHPLEGRRLHHLDGHCTGVRRDTVVHLESKTGLLILCVFFFSGLIDVGTEFSHL